MKLWTLEDNGDRTWWPKEIEDQFMADARALRRQYIQYGDSELGKWKLFAADMKKLQTIAARKAKRAASMNDKGKGKAKAT